jgi:hypothetical protein
LSFTSKDRKDDASPSVREVQEKQYLAVHEGNTRNEISALSFYKYKK